MAENPVPPRGRAANVSRRSLLGSIAASPFAGAIDTTAPLPSEWERVLKIYTAAHYQHEAFVAASLQPAYRRFEAGLHAALISGGSGREPVDLRTLRMHVREVERAVIDAGGGRAEILRTRKADSTYAEARTTLAAELRHQRKRGHLLREQGVRELEEESNDLLSVKYAALRRMLLTPAIDKSSLILKVRIGYQEIFAHEDDDGTIRAIFADVERLLA